MISFFEHKTQRNSFNETVGVGNVSYDGAHCQSTWTIS